jgi:hypothetical protein
LAGELEYGDRVLTGDTGIVRKELVQSVIPFDVVDEGPDWHSRSRENLFSPETSRVA